MERMKELRRVDVTGTFGAAGQVTIFEDHIDGEKVEIGTFVVPGWASVKLMMTEYFNKGWRTLRSDDTENGQRFFTIYKYKE